ncbi:MAG: hypothetical protein AAFW89_09050, partial [Bacteroidota bacterium]
MSNERIDNVHQQLSKAHDKLDASRFRLAVFSGVAIGLGGILLFFLLEYTFYFSPIVKTSGWAIAVLIGFSLAFIQNKRNPGTTFQHFYLLFSRNSNLKQVKDALELTTSGGGNPQLIEAAVLQNLSQVPADEFSRKLDEFVRTHPAFVLYKRMGLLVILLCISLGSVSFTFPDGMIRTLTFWETYEQPNPYQYVLLPGTTTIEQGTQATISVEFTSQLIPENLTLYLKTGVEDAFRSRNLERISEQAFQSLPIDVNSAFSYYIDMDGFKTPEYQLSVELRPRFLTLQAVVDAPEYTQLSKELVQYPNTQVRAYKGSGIEFRGSLNKPVNELTIISFSKGDTLTFKPDSAFSFSL